MLSAGSSGRTWELEVGAEGCAPVAGEFAAWSMQYCKNVLCFGDVGKVAKAD